jgi:hypothetical protein
MATAPVKITPTDVAAKIAVALRSAQEVIRNLNLVHARQVSGSLANRPGSSVETKAQTLNMGSEKCA